MALILVVDDEYLVAIMLADMLEDEGHEVVTAANGRLALDAIASRRPDLVITDFMMPVMTGLELAETLRGSQPTADVPILLVSGAQGGIARGRPDLFDAVLDKPYQTGTMIDRIRALLAGPDSPPTD